MAPCSVHPSPTMKFAAALCCVVLSVTAEPPVGHAGGVYGPPAGTAPHHSLASQFSGYDGGDNNIEPANYEFNYDVDAPEYVRFGHQEARQGDVAQGKYYVLLPDGRTQTVEYIADQDGYRPKISYEGGGQGNGGGAGGYGRGPQGGSGRGPPSTGYRK